jgi:hypothetical protein
MLFSALTCHPYIVTTTLPWLEEERDPPPACGFCEIHTEERALDVTNTAAKSTVLHNWSRELWIEALGMAAVLPPGRKRRM